MYERAGGVVCLKPPMGALAIQKRSLSAFSRCRTSMPVTLMGFAAARGRSPCGVFASLAAGPGLKAGGRPLRRVLGLFANRPARRPLFGELDQLLADHTSL